jgi:hypothetical protein
MCCGVKSHPGAGCWGHHHGGFHACGGPSHFGPRFWIKEEGIAWLEQYLKDLREEAKAIEERLAELKEEK